MVSIKTIFMLYLTYVLSTTSDMNNILSDLILLRFATIKCIIYNGIYIFQQYASIYINRSNMKLKK